jgi:hypothetical protein
MNLFFVAAIWKQNKYCLAGSFQQRKIARITGLPVIHGYHKRKETYSFNGSETKADPKYRILPSLPYAYDHCLLPSSDFDLPLWFTSFPK